MMRSALLFACACLLAPTPALTAGGEARAAEPQRPLSISVNIQSWNQARTLLGEGDDVYALAVRHRASGGDEPQWVEGAYREASASLGSVNDGKLHRMLVFSSSADLERAIPSLPASLDAVAYETGAATPEKELKTLEKSLKRFADAARKRRLVVEWRPSAAVASVNLRDIPKLARHVDRVVFDNQEVLRSEGYGEFTRAIMQQADLVRHGNPACRVGLIFRLGAADVERTWRALSQASSSLDHLSLFSLKDDGALKRLVGRLR